MLFGRHYGPAGASARSDSVEVAPCHPVDVTEPISEFTDTYSDDLIFLETVRKTVLRNPFEVHLPMLLDATTARLYTVMLVGNVENDTGINSGMITRTT